LEDVFRVEENRIAAKRFKIIYLLEIFGGEQNTNMGKPFEIELGRLSETYDWAMSQNITPLAEFVRAVVGGPACFLGSGGSLSAATFGAYLHEQVTTQVAEALTPLPFSARPEFSSNAVLMMSAGGKNRDILSAYRNAVERDTKHLGVICFDPKSPLARLAHKVWTTELFCAHLPTGRDGFLAANSLLAFFVLLARVYQRAGYHKFNMPENAKAARDGALWSEHELARALSRRYLIVLFGPHTRAAAVDLESKLSEAALGAVQLVDYRNFAHGRHHWIAKHSGDTGLVGFVSEDVQQIADRTFDAIGKRVPIGRISLQRSGVSAGISALLATFEATRLAGVLRGIDPGRPGVPEFGRRIYHLQSTRAITPIGTSPSLRLVAFRKLGTPASLSVPLALLRVGESAKRFEGSLSRESYGAVLFDFDGTLCSNHERFSALRKDVAAAIESLLRKRVTVGIATGRGKSVRIQMQKSIKRAMWERIWVGYYNGSQIARLSEDIFPNVSGPVNPAINRLDKLLRSDALLNDVATITTRPAQITLEAKGPAFTPKDLCRYASRFLQGVDEIRILFSTHSVDIIPRSVSKVAVLQKLQSIIGKEYKVLCIGDLGEFPGNDFELLAHPYSLSCDEVSADESSCWNLAPGSFRGVQAVLYYLKHMRINQERFKLVLPAFREES
jgi:fructoselysine-6-P-deglycase FrlB-like protein